MSDLYNDEYIKEEQASRDFINSRSYSNDDKSLLISYVDLYFPRYHAMRVAFKKMIRIQNRNRSGQISSYNNYDFQESMQFLKQKFSEDYSELSEECEFFKALFKRNHTILERENFIEHFCEKHFKDRPIPNSRTWSDEDDFSRRKQIDCENIFEFDPFDEGEFRCSESGI